MEVIFKNWLVFVSQTSDEIFHNAWFEFYFKGTEEKKEIIYHELNLWGSTLLD